MKESIWHRLFEASIALKLFNSVWQIAGGIGLFFVSPHWLVGTATRLASRELLRDPHDSFAQAMMAQSQHFSLGTRDFMAWYFLFHGLLNLFLVFNLWRGRIWAYLVTILLTLLMVCYQFYRFAHTHSWILLALTLFDIIFVVLTWHEYLYRALWEDEPLA
jgi:uncharacterized membrane protein